MTTPVVTVRGEAELGGPPDLATLSATVHATAADADQVRRHLATASTLLRAITEQHAAALERHATSGLHVGPVFSGRRGRTVTGYRGSLSTELVDTALGALLEVSDLDGSFAHQPRAFKAAFAADAGGMPEPELDLEPAEQRVSAQVTVRFQLA